jgi:hypothetical protein
MTKRIPANRFGLAVLTLALFASTAFAGAANGAVAAQGPQQVVVSNTGANPVPTAVQGTVSVQGIVSLNPNAQAMPVTVQTPQYYQTMQTVDCSAKSHATFTFNVPSGKTFLIRDINVFMGSFDPSDTFGIFLYTDSSSGIFAGPLQPIGAQLGYGVNWGVSQPVQLSATKTVTGTVSRPTAVTACVAYITLSGELL